MLSCQRTCQTTTSREQGRELVRMSVGCSARVASSDLVARAISPGPVIFMCLNAWNSEFTCPPSNMGSNL